MQHLPFQERWPAMLAWCKQMREDSPVSYDEQTHLWNLFHYDDVVRVLSDPTTFSSQITVPRQADDFFSIWSKGDITKMDPPRHRHFRNLISQAFTPRVVELLAPNIEDITNQLLDKVADKGEMDIVRDLAAPLPIIVIADMLGVPREDRDRFKFWSDTLMSFSSGGVDVTHLDEIMLIFKEMFAYLEDFCQERRKHPQQDMITRLTTAEVEGKKLDDDEIKTFIVTLLVAGNITTTILLSNIILCFDEYPDSMAALLADPSLIPSAIEEVLRYRPPFTATIRKTTTDVTIQGVTIPAEQLVTTWLLSANHDQQQFPEPERFDILRQPNRHQAFGHGIHFCIGAPLARLEAKIALGILLKRFPSLKCVSGAKLETYPSVFINGVKNLPVTW